MPRMMRYRIGVRLAGGVVEHFRGGKITPSIGDYLRRIWTVLRVFEAKFAQYYAMKAQYSTCKQRKGVYQGGKTYFAEYWSRSRDLWRILRALEVKLVHHDASKHWCDACL